MMRLLVILLSLINLHCKESSSSDLLTEVGNGQPSGATSTTTTTETKSDATVFAITGPSSLTNDATPTVTWQNSEGAVFYTLILATEGSCKNVILTLEGLTTNSTVLPELQSQTYGLCLSASDINGVKRVAVNSGKEFAIDTQSPPVPAAPVDEGTGTSSVSTTFTWQAVVDLGSSGIGGYNLRVGTSPGKNDVFSGDVGNVTLTSVPNLPADATVYAAVQSYDKAGNVSAWSSSSDGLTVDRSLNSPPTTLITAANSSSGSDARFDSDGTFYAVWSGASDLGAGIRDYTVLLYSQSSCSGSASITSGVTNSYLAITGSSGTTYSFRVRAFDRASNFGDSGCSGSMTIDGAAPPALDGFSGTAGTVTGDIALSLNFPADTSDYASVILRRAAGATAPADCTTGTALTATSVFTDRTITDSGLTAGAVYSYRACIYDSAGNLNSSSTAVNITAKFYRHTIFASSTTIASGSVGGLEGLDTFCQARATAAGLTSPTSYIAVASSSTEDAIDRVIVKGEIYNTFGEKVADDKKRPLGRFSRQRDRLHRVWGP